jgi:hypothetical protein
MVETGRQSDPNIIGLIRRVQDTDTFLRMAAIALRDIANSEPHLAAELRDIADQFESEAASLRQVADGEEGVGFV